MTKLERDRLVEEVEAEKCKPPLGSEAVRCYNNALDKAIAIIRAHTAPAGDEIPDFTRIAVAKALCKWRNGKRSSVGFTELSMAEQFAYFEQADDAIAAYEHARKG